jgi:beta-lactamase regulating signal transducer with metallopeptidase domain
MSAWMLTGTVRGSAILLAVVLADTLAGHFVRARGRRLWWALVPAAFLLPAWASLPFLDYRAADFTNHSLFSTPLAGPRFSIAEMRAAFLIIHPPFLQGGWDAWLSAIWLAGVLVSAVFVLAPTWRAHRAWSRLRFSTDAGLLGLLEDAKETAGVTAPIGLVVSEKVPAPALLGWLRPRLLLPRALAESAATLELKAIFLHELAHFRALDIPLNWLFTLARTLHWFNPLAHLANSAWARFREEAADENAICWLNECNSHGYGEILLKTLRQCSGGAPFGALAIGESLNQLKRRMLMIRLYPAKFRWNAPAWLATVLFAAVLAWLPTVSAQEDTAGAKKDAVAAMLPWLAEMDSGDYAKSWSDASSSFQKAVSSDQWVSMSQAVRTPLGKLISREQVSALYDESIPGPSGKTIPGPYVIAQFKTSFENLKYAVETVTFDKIDGTWREAGYYIKPGS